MTQLSRHHVPADRAQCTRGDIGDFLPLIYECNRIEPEMFGLPTLEQNDRGEWVEGYDHARVVNHDDGSITIEAKTERGSDVLVEAITALGL